MKEKGMKEEKESQGVMWFCGSAVLRFRGFAVLRQTLNFVVVWVLWICSCVLLYGFRGPGSEWDG